MVTPSLVIVGAPNFLSRTTYRPLGPSVTLTALATASTPCSSALRASASYFSSLRAISLVLLERVCCYWTLASTSDSRRTSSSSPSTLISVPPYLLYRTSSPSATSSGVRLPVSSLTLPSPTARTLPFWGFSFAVSERTMPLAVCSSSSIARTINRSPRGLSFIYSTSGLGRELPILGLGTLRLRVPVVTDYSRCVL